MNDLISRQAVFETIDACNSDGLKGIFCSYDDGERFKEYIKKLPPATPTRKKGYWIDHSEEGFVECSECGSCTNCDGNINNLHFCFSCGAEMESKE